MKKVLIPAVALAVTAAVLAILLLARRGREKDVLVSQEVIPRQVDPVRPPTEGLVEEALKEEGRDFQMRLVAEIRSDARTVYSTLVDFDQLKGIIPDCTKLDVVETSGNRTVVYMKRFILFMGKEMGGNVEYTLHPEELKFEMKVLRDPNANLYERWSVEPAGENARVTYLVDVEPKLKVPIFMAQEWVKGNFVDLMKALKVKLERRAVTE